MLAPGILLCLLFLLADVLAGIIDAGDVGKGEAMSRARVVISSLLTMAGIAGPRFPMGAVRYEGAGLMPCIMSEAVVIG